MIYLDTSALAKLVIREPETAALNRWLRRRQGQVWVTSVVGRIELIRAVRRAAVSETGASLLLAGLDTIPLATYVADLAQTAEPPTLRTLDAIHLASALSVGAELSAFCCYDNRLQDAASEAGLAVHAPGT